MPPLSADSFTPWFAVCKSRRGCWGTGRLAFPACLLFGFFEEVFSFRASGWFVACDCPVVLFSAGSYWEIKLFAVFLNFEWLNCRFFKKVGKWKETPPYLHGKSPMSELYTEELNFCLAPSWILPWLYSGLFQGAGPSIPKWGPTWNDLPLAGVHGKETQLLSLSHWMYLSFLTGVATVFMPKIANGRLLLGCNKAEVRHFVIKS